MKANLCKCNKCDVVLIDENPQKNAPEFEIPEQAKEMQLIDNKDGGFWACPICADDGSLIDITKPEQLTNL